MLICCEQDLKWNKGKCNIMSPTIKVPMGTSISRINDHGCCFKCKLNYVASVVLIQSSFLVNV